MLGALIESCGRSAVSVEEHCCIDINCNAIPQGTRTLLLAMAYESANEYFKQPGVAEEFERWKAARKEKEASA